MADVETQEWQTKIKPADYLHRPIPYGFEVYGEVLTYPRPCESQLEHYDFCKAYSAACPEAELADVHLSAVGELMSTKDFEAARPKGCR